MNHKIGILFFSILVVYACDETLPKEQDPRSQMEQFLTRDWRYSYILMDGDTMRNLAADGEPSTTEFRDFTPIGLRYLAYRVDYTYELKSLGPTFFSLAGEPSYQPNYGVWDLDEETNPPTLIHNLFANYEVRYEVIELTETRMEREMIGDRVTLMWINFNANVIDTITVSSWIEVFEPLPD